MSRPQFSQEQVEIAKRTVQIVSEAHGDYPYHESVTPDDIRGHTLRREDITMSYKVRDNPLWVAMQERNERVVSLRKSLQARSDA